jgi:hypothetical protein
MGWTFAYDQSHRSDLIAERTKKQEWINADGTKIEGTALKHCYKGGMRSGVLYIVWERTRTPKDGTPTTERFIEIDLLQFRKDKELGSSWGYKDMDCCTGPYNVSCPVSYLELCPPHEGSQWCKGWHQKVREAAAKRAETREKVKGLKVGDTVALIPGCNVNHVTITSLRPLMGESGYRQYKIKANLIDWPRIAAGNRPEDATGLPAYLVRRN